MKTHINSLIYLCLILSLSANFFACNQQPENKKKQEEVPDVIKQPQSIVDFSSIGYKDMLISPEIANNWINAYRENRHKKDTTLTKSVWYSKDVIIWLGKQMDAAPAETDGIRIFFIEYPPVNDSTQPGRNGKKQTGLVFVPTKNKIADWSFWKPLMDSPKFTFNALNHGELCPTNCCVVNGISTDCN